MPTCGHGGHPLPIERPRLHESGGLGVQQNDATERQYIILLVATLRWLALSAASAGARPPRAVAAANLMSCVTPGTLWLAVAPPASSSNNTGTIRLLAMIEQQPCVVSAGRAVYLNIKAAGSSGRPPVGGGGGGAPGCGYADPSRVLEVLCPPVYKNLTATRTRRSVGEWVRTPRPRHIRIPQS